MTPIPLDFVFALPEAGYPTDLLYRVGIGRVIDVQNMAASIPRPATSSASCRQKWRWKTSRDTKP